MISSDARSFTYKGQDGYFQPPHSIYPLPDGLSTGFIVLGTCGMLSFAATLSLLSFVAYRFITWKNHYTTFIGYNQYVLLFLNLCFADLCQAASFLVSFHWRREEAILAPTTACQAQGFLLHLGDVASAFFVLAIAVHTYWTAVMSRRVPYRVFGCLIVILWLIVIFLTVIGLAIHQDTYFVRAGAWCWISSDYEPERLGLHYFWVFLSEFGLIVLYAVTFFQLRQKTNSLFSTADRNAGISVTNQKSIDAVNRITTLMMLYPLVYVVLTLPLSAARMWSMARGGQTPSDVTNIATGALLASCGWVDCLLYTLTRERLLANTMNSKKDSSNGTDTGASRSDHQSKGGTILQTTTWTVQNESFDLDRNVEGNTAEVEAYSDPNSVRDLSPGRSKSETSGNARDRSPSPTGSVDPIITREQQQQQQSNVSRMLSATRRKDFAPGSEKVYELDTFHS